MKQLSRAALLSTLSSLALLASPAAAQNASAPPPSQPQAPDAGQADAADGGLNEPDAIVVTGTRRSDRTVADSPVPVDVIGSEAITNTGQTETNRILNQLVPSFNFPSRPSPTARTRSARPPCAG